MTKTLEPTLVEGKFGHGAIHINPVHRWFRRKLRPMVGRASVPFDWNKGYDVETKIGKVLIKNQGASSSCGGQSASYLRAIIRAIQTGEPYQEESAKSIYAPTAFPGGGTTIPVLESYVTHKGSNFEAEVASYDNSNPPSEAFMTDKSWMTALMVENALKKAGCTTLSVAIDINSFAEAMRDYGCIIMEIRGQNNGSWTGPTPLPPIKTSNQPLWQHFMCSKGSDMPQGLERSNFFNSWGEETGENGIQHFYENYFDSGHILDAFTFILPQGTVPLNQPIPELPGETWFQWFCRMLFGYGVYQGNN